MIKQQIIKLLKKAAAEAQKSGKLPSVALPEIAIEHPQNPEHGDYASSFPLKLARTVGVKPLTIAEDVAAFIKPTPEIESITVAPPGFINFTLKNDWLTEQVDTIRDDGDAYGNMNLGKGSRVQLEFVSVNPTGPLHVGHGRGAILGSTLANVLSAIGYNVEKEYYVNDAGSQMLAFYRSLYARYQQALGEEAEMPAEGYF
ncbi:MAG: arginine--tRNA ligase, partial [Dehalococcoidia bacterium]